MAMVAATVVAAMEVATMGMVRVIRKARIANPTPPPPTKATMTGEAMEDGTLLVVELAPPGDTVLLALRNILEGQNWGRTQGLIIKHPPDAYRDGDFIYEYLDYLEAYGRRTFGRDATLPGWKDRFAKALVASIPVDGRQAESLIVVVRMLDPDTVTWEEFSKCLTKTFGSGTSRTKAYRKAFDDGKWVQRQKSAITTFSVGLKYAQLSYPKLSWRRQVDKVVSRFAESAPAGAFWTALAAMLTQ
ncbi:hypothetical protein HK102_011332, partial [Quaeritorhiza haematococci]